ncbi:hypothetical protein LEMLEM_LOCUS24982, partial [Lemmus lemmus]
GEQWRPRAPESWPRCWSCCCGGSAGWDIPGTRVVGHHSLHRAPLGQGNRQWAAGGFFLRSGPGETPTLPGAWAREAGGGLGEATPFAARSLSSGPVRSVRVRGSPRGTCRRRGTRSVLSPFPRLVRFSSPPR